MLHMPFFNRTYELEKLSRALGRDRRQLIIVYGRRRIGKSTLLLRQLDGKGVYYQASRATEVLQRDQFTTALSKRLPVLSGARFDDWDSLLNAVIAATHERFTLVIDELPYLVESAPALPSFLQRLVDRREQLPFDLILCGSSQQMMRSLILSATAPLYGRADEILKIAPLPAGWLVEGFPHLTAAERVREYATWGGIPRYWELRQQYDTYDEAVRELVLQPTGILHEEPNRLLLEDLRTIQLSASIINYVANGAHRLSEIAGRLQRPATDLARPLQRLIEMGYLYRERPYGVPSKNNKKSLYKIADPFMRFHYHFVAPNLSELRPNRIPSAWNRLRTTLPNFIAAPWEQLCASSVATAPPYMDEFRQPARWWGTGTARKPMEIDLVSESHDGKRLLVGECKWSDVTNAAQLREQLIAKAKQLPFYNEHIVEAFIFGRSFQQPDLPDYCWTPERVLSYLHY